MFDKRSLVIPDGTRFEERTIRAPGDIILGNHVRVEFGLGTPGRVFGGEKVEVHGPVESAKEMRFDHFSRIEGDVQAGGNVYLGDRTRIEGRLTAGGDLDVGDDVAIARGFEAKGWINIRSPVPVVIYLFLYILEMLRLGKSEEVEKLLQELEASQERIRVGEGFLYVPDGSVLGLTDSLIRGNLWIGKDCRVLGNHVVQGDVVVGPGTKVYGALRSSGPVKVQAGAEVQGTIESGDRVTIGDGVRVLGDIRAQQVDLFQNAVIDGRLVAPGGIRFTSRQSFDLDEKVDRYAAGMRDDVVDLLG